MMTKAKPKFEGIPLIEIPKVIPYADFARGEFGEAVEEEYNARVRENYKGHPHLKGILVYDKEDKVLKGLSPFANVVLNNLDIVREQRLEIATQADLERILRLKREDFNLDNTYEDSSLALRSEKGTNAYLANDLTQQVRERQELEFPVMIHLKELDVELDENSNNEYGLRFLLKENAEIIYAPILNKPGRFSSEDVDEKIGLPQKTGEEGGRYLYTIDSGLSGVCLVRGRDAVADGDYLAGSNRSGRVVLVSGEATPKNFEEQINKEYQEQLAQLNSRKEKALEILRGKE